MMSAKLARPPAQRPDHGFGQPAVEGGLHRRHRGLFTQGEKPRRGEDGDVSQSIQVSFISIDLHTDIEDPHERLRAIHESALEAKAVAAKVKALASAGAKPTEPRPVRHLNVAFVDAPIVWFSIRWWRTSRASRGSSRRTSTKFSCATPRAI